MSVLNKEFENFISGQDDDGVWKFYLHSLRELRKRGLIRTKHIVGERGKYLALKFYALNKGEPKLLQVSPTGTKNVDALSPKGTRYNIKTLTTSRRITGVFWGLNPPESKEEDRKVFEFLIIVILDENLELLELLEVPWKLFLEQKRWSKSMNTWRVRLTNELKTKSRIVFSKDN